MSPQRFQEPASADELGATQNGKVGATFVAAYEILREEERGQVVAFVFVVYLVNPVALLALAGRRFQKQVLPKAGFLVAVQRAGIGEGIHCLAYCGSYVGRLQVLATLENTVSLGLPM